MGAVHFSLDPVLAGLLARSLGADLCVETGTFAGDGVAAARKVFTEVHSIELSPELHARARERFRDDPGVVLHQGDSGAVLAGLLPGLAGRPAVFWLDAHWCAAGDVSGEPSASPLLAELAAIGSLGADCAVLVDDARLYLAPPADAPDPGRWPRLEEVLKAMRGMAPGHAVMVVNDVIVLYPPAASPVLEQYAREHGVDWLDLSHRAARADALREAGEAKDREFGRLEAEIEALRAVCAERRELLERQEIQARELRASCAEKDGLIVRLAGEAATQSRAAAERLDLVQRLTAESEERLRVGEERRLLMEALAAEAAAREAREVLLADELARKEAALAKHAGFIRAVRSLRLGEALALWRTLNAGKKAGA